MICTILCDICIDEYLLLNILLYRVCRSMNLCRKASYYKQQMTDWDILQCEESHLELDEQDLQWLRLLNESKGEACSLATSDLAGDQIM